MQGQQKLQYTIIILCWIIWFLNFATRMTLSAILPLIKAEFNLSHTQAASLLSAQGLSYASTILIAGILADKVRRKSLIITSVLSFSTASILCGFTRSYLELLIALTLSGLGLALYLAAGVSLISASFKEESRGKALGLHETAASLGQTFGPILASIVASIFNWRTPFILISILGYGAAIFFAKSVKEPSRINFRDEAVEQSLRKILGNRSTITLVICYVLMAIFSVGIVSFIPLYLVELGVQFTFAGSIFGLSRIVGVAGSVTGGTLSDKLGRKPVITVSAISTIGSVIVFLCLPVNTWLYTMLFVLAFATSFFFPTAFAYISDITRTRRGTLVGLCSTLAMFFGAAITPAIIGFLADTYGSLRLALILPTALTASLLVIALIFFNR